MLSLMTFIPLIGMLVILCLPKDKPQLVRYTAVVATLLPLLLGIKLFLAFDRANPGIQFVERFSWIPMFNINYYLGIDGLSIGMVILTTLLSFLCIYCSVRRRNLELEMCVDLFVG